MMTSIFWIPATLVAAIAQVFRNGLQANLTRDLGTLGATQVRFLYGLPFALIMLFTARWALSETAPEISGEAFRFTLLGALAQIASTALMLITMAKRDFGVAYAYIKTEPVLVALFGVVLLGDHLTPLGWAGIIIATAGILVISIDPRQWRALIRDWHPIAIGVAAGAGFGLSAVAFRGAIVALEQGSALNRALTISVAGLAIQSLLLGVWLLIFNRPALTGSLRLWRQSLGAGFLGALATAGWFTAFSLSIAANVRTLALIEMPVAGWFNRRVSGKRLNGREWLGTMLVMAGIGLMLWAIAG